MKIGLVPINDRSFAKAWMLKMSGSTSPARPAPGYSRASMPAAIADLTELFRSAELFIG
jgi:hypothetical protein